MTPLAFRFLGSDLLLDPSGALFHPERRWLAVADLHLEKGSAAAARGRLLPPYDTRATLDRLEDAIARLAPERVLSVGDGFHDVNAGDRLLPDDLERVRALTGRFDWVWILGNHDPFPPDGVGGRAVEAFEDAPLTFRHQPTADGLGEVAGHLHPVATIPTGARAIRGKCLVHDGARIILPAFGAFTGGLDVRDSAIRGLLGPRFDILMPFGERVFRLPGDRSTGGRRNG